MQPQKTLRTFGDPEDLAKAAAQQLLTELAALGSRTLHIALPGGRIYGLFFPILAQMAAAMPGALGRVHFFWGDERCVPPEHEESNFRLANEHLLRPLQVSPDHVHRIRGELEPSTAAELAERELCALVPCPSGVPVLDYVFLGMGEDGHVASLFPGESSSEITRKAVFRAVVGPKPPANRVTLGYDPLCAATNLWVLVSGAGKSGALKQSLSSSGSTPLGRVLARRTQALIFADFEV